jgi:carboxylate-amine ligase
LEELGDLDRVTGWLRQLVRDGDGATRQRRVAGPRGRLSDVVDHLIARTVPTDAAVPVGQPQHACVTTLSGSREILG